MWTRTILSVLVLGACGSDSGGASGADPADVPSAPTDVMGTDTVAGTDGVDPDTRAPGDDAEVAGTEDTRAPGVATLAETVAAACPNAQVKSNPPNSLSAGTDLHKVTLNAPGAVCNDGTPAVMYVRAATTPQAAARWVLHTQGGASCRDYQQCVDRWCGDQSPVYDQSKMSSADTPETIGGKGIFNPTEQNPFGNLNQVFFCYCSSDQWQGRNLETVLTAPSGAQMVMPMAGFRILEAAVAALKAGVTSDDGEVTLPPLGEATVALWTGVSAGSTGAQHTVDWFASQLDPEQTRVVGVFDAGVFIDPDVIDDPAVAQAQRDRVVEAWAGNIADIDGFVDESCLAAEPAETQYRCLDTHYTKLNHMSTPFFQRADLADPASSASFLEFGGTKAQYAADTLETVAQYPASTGLYVPRCGQHVGITNNAWFLNATVESASGEALTFAEALRRWLVEEAENAVDDGSGEQSVCQNTTGDLS